MSDQAKLSDLLLDACSTFGGASACEDAHAMSSYAALGMRARAIADALHRLDLKPDEPVLVPVSNQASDIEAFPARCIRGALSLA